MSGKMSDMSDIIINFHSLKLMSLLIYSLIINRTILVNFIALI